MMTVDAGKAIWFECGYCGHGQYADYSLDSDWDVDRGAAVMADNIDCEKCGKENRVVEDL